MIARAVLFSQLNGGWASALRTTRGALASVFFPAPCRICEAVLDGAGRVPICEKCLASFQKLAPPMCSRCGRPIISPVAADSLMILCRLCRADTYDFDVARSFALYDEPMVRAILLLKHEGIPPLGSWFAAQLANLAKSGGEALTADVVVPVPLHKARRRERGYNQAELIARPLARLLKLPLAATALVRTKPRPGVLRLTRKQRWEAVRGAFEPFNSALVDKRRVLLVDDVFTTGATLDACSRALRRAGAAHVVALTVARAAPDWAAQGV
jgi:ComF family protein